MSDPSGLGARQSTNGDWPAEAADTIVRVVGQVRDKTTGPAITVARGVVYGLLAGIVGAMALVLLAIMAVRLIDVYLPESVTGDDNTWVAHALVGLLFVVAGLVLWSRRSPRADEA
jgi:hypothetical protein